MRTDSLQIAEIKVSTPIISMAPLVDIIFLLLIFFMVTTVFPDEGIIVEKPAAEQSGRLIDNKLLISIDKDGNVYYRKQRLTPDDIKHLVSTELIKNPDVAVIVNVDKRAVTERLIYVIDTAKSSGATKLGIATDRKVTDEYGLSQQNWF